MSGTGLALRAQPLNFASGTKPRPLQRNSRYLVLGMRYRTPADVRAIPNAQWERWVRGYESFPFSEFSSEWSVQKTVTTILDATERRLGLPPKRRPKPKPSLARIAAVLLETARQQAERAKRHKA